MAKEIETKKKAIQELISRGWLIWYPSKIRYKQNDIFGIIDLLALKRRKMRYIQLTTLPNLARQRKKILNFFKKEKVKLPVEIWVWLQKKKKFKIEMV
ncbi:MAG: hypothetical protein COX89_01550 [Candidatus Nealsonbacteria bacterium CG_4_10_14_0_2_um_filter_37_10]|uniref:Uncharacterized protein n=1 Tax=Candidatus Nealsonbacteria bacterium CG_4_10_14_0_2_um_filter_37_10 TaxID=1974679 RepID=A0A2M7UZQ5_9BACT|nr:MAG: hypothetical protein COX89_01550 [Candidatus Nealsonbacteria bacterium CG_4_10_14_0_2_um_filter_37_10]